MSEELQTIIDLIRYGASRFNAAGLTFGHSYDNAVDEATHLVLHTLHLPHDLGPEYCLHLMSVVSPVREDLAVVYERLAPVALLQALQARGIQALPVPEDDYLTLG